MEREFIQFLRGKLPPHPRLRLGIGDDAALLQWAHNQDLVVTTDLLTDGVHFLARETDARRIGRKALAVNLSDLAAMAARPVAAVIALALPRDKPLEIARELYEGILPLAEEFDVIIAGGDANVWNGSLVINVTALGEVQPGAAWTRGGAQPGDVLLVTGPLGGSILGRHLDFTPLCREALFIAANYPIHAAMDISDGLLLDLSRMLKESECGAALSLSEIPIHADALRLAEQDAAKSALDHAMSDGEDFQLLLAAPPDVARRLIADKPQGLTISQIGVCTAELGMRGIHAAGTNVALLPRGFEHGA